MVARRTWIKLYVQGWLHGDMKDESITYKGVWATLLAMAGDSAYGDKGVIQFGEDVGFTDEQYVSSLKISDMEWQNIKSKLSDQKRIKVLKKNCIKIVNWEHYQSEYDRQKKYRGNK